MPQQNRAFRIWALSMACSALTAPLGAQSALGSASPRSLTQAAGAGGTTLFVANPGSGRAELYRTDGSLSGATSIGSFVAADDIASPGHLTVAGAGRVFFSGDDGGGAGTELWFSDLTAAGTRLVVDAEPGARSSYPQSLLALPSGLVIYSATTSAHGRELWASDGVTATRLADLNPGGAGSDPREFVLVGARAFFSADDGSSGRELWVTDGTGLGTYRVRDLYPGKLGASPNALFAHQGEIWFSARDGVHGFELWRSNGSAAGTRLIVDARPGPASSLPGDLVAAFGKVWFVAHDGNGPARIYSTDGTASGTAPFGMGPLGPRSPSDLTLAASRLWFVAEDAQRGAELWTSDGTPAGTRVVRDVRPGPNPSHPTKICELDSSSVVFVADDGVRGRELWRADANGANLVRELWPGPTSGRIAEIRRVGGRVLFGAQARDGAGNELFMTDGTAAGTVRLEDLNRDSEQLTLDLLHTVTPSGTQMFEFVMPASRPTILLFARELGPGIDLNAYGFPSYGLLGIDLASTFFFLTSAPFGPMTSGSPGGTFSLLFHIDVTTDVSIVAQALTLDSPIDVSGVSSIRSGPWDMSRCPGCASVPITMRKALYVDDTYEYDLVFSVAPLAQDLWLRVIRLSADGNEEEVEMVPLRAGSTRVQGHVELRRSERIQLRVYCGDPAGSCWVAKTLGC